MNHTRCVAAVVLGLSAVALAQPAAHTTRAAQPAGAARHANSAVTPVSKENEKWWKDRNDSFNARAKQGAENGDIDLIFVGDSITQGWETAGKGVWDKYYGSRHAFNIGISGDRTEHVLWRLDHGNVDGLAHPARGHAPKLAVVMIGTNNSNGNDNTAEEIADGIKAVVARLRDKLPTTKVLLLAVFPRGEHPDPQREKNAKASELASKVADGRMVHYLDIGASFLQPDGTLPKDVMPDFLHPNEKGYEIWARAIEPKVKELLGDQTNYDRPAPPNRKGT